MSNVIWNVNWNANSSGSSTWLDQPRKVSDPNVRNNPSDPVPSRPNDNPVQNPSPEKAGYQHIK